MFLPMRPEYLHAFQGYPRRQILGRTSGDKRNPSLLLQDGGQQRRKTRIKCRILATSRKRRECAIVVKRKQPFVGFA